MRPKHVALGLLTIVLVAALSAGMWAFRVATSDIRGAGDATIRKNSAVNRVAAQERFEDLYQEVLTSDRRVDVAHQCATSGECVQLKEKP